jgi:hypothetical protein
MFAASSPKVMSHRDKLIANKGALKEKLKNMYEEQHDLFAGRRTNFNNTQDRNKCVSEAFDSAIAMTP